MRWLLAAVLSAVLLDAQAQKIDDVTMLTQEADVIARISFAGNVRLIQQSPTTAAPLYQIRLDFAGTEDALLAQNVDESRRQEAALGAPSFSLLIKAAPRQKLRQMILQLDSTAAVRVKPGPNVHSLDIVFTGLNAAYVAPVPAASVPAAAVAPDAAASGAEPAAALGAAASAAPLTETDVQGNDLLAKAKEAMTAKQNDRATVVLGQLLRLPPNVASQEAQELIGLAYERSGDTKRAQVEYELYLKLFPKGEGADRVSQRLATITALAVQPSTDTAPAGAAAPAKAEAPKKNPFSFTGNLAQYYFGGKARAQSLVNLPSGIDQSTLTKTTESALVTSLDIAGRYQGDDSDIRMSVRGSGATNLAASSHNASNLSASYVDYRQPSTGLAVRLGRQSPINGGLMGLFDGVSVAYPLKQQDLRVNVMAGVPANTLVAASSQRMVAAMLEADNLGEHWGGNVYVLGQTTEGFIDRSAIGSELRYSDDIGSGYALVDYDTRFKTLNALSLQGSVQGSGQTSYTLLVDNRRAPTLELNSALISAVFDRGQVPTLKNLLAKMSMTDAMNTARSSSAIARQVMFSVSRPLSEKWQATGDVRYSAVGALPDVGNFLPTQATGAQYGVTLQLTGSNLYSKRDINNFNVSLLNTPSLKGYQLSYNNLTSVMGDQVTVEPSARFYSQRDSQAGTLQRISPGLRLSYRLSKKTSVMGEGLLEHSKTETTIGNSTINSIFFYFGYRYDLF